MLGFTIIIGVYVRKNKKTEKFARVHSPQVRFVLRHFHDTNSTAQSPVVHCSTQLPNALLGSINFDGFQIGRTIEPAYRIQLTVDDSQTNLSRPSVNEQVIS